MQKIPPDNESKNASERVLRLTQKLAKVGSFDYSIVHNTVIWSDEMYDIFGISQEHGPLTYEQVNQMIHPDDRQMHRDQTDSIMTEGHYSFEHRLVYPDGTIHWLWGSAEMEYDTSGKPLRMFGVSQDITRRKEAENALIQSDLQLSLITDNIPAFVAYVGIDDLHYRFVNIKFEKSFGLPREQIVGRHIKEIIGESNFQFAQKHIDEVRAGRASSYENTFSTTEGNRWLNVNYVPSFDVKGNVEGIMVLSVDITKRKQAEQALLQEKIFIDALLESIPGYLYVYDDQGNLIKWNKKHETMTGYSAEELSHMNISKWYEGNDAIRVAAAVEEVMTTGYGEVEANLLIKGGGKLLVHSNGVRLLLNGKTYFTGVGVDITARKQSELALAAEKERLAVTLRSIGDGVITTDSHGAITMLNNAAEKLTGWTTQEAAGKLLPEVFCIINELTRKPCENPFTKVIATGGIVELANHTCLIAKDGREIVIADSGAPIRDKDSTIIGVVLVFRDMTEKQKLEDSRQKAQKLESLGLLAGGIAHDFNNLLGGMFGYVEIAKESIDENQPEKARKALVKSFDVFERTKALTQQLLTFAKGGAPMRKTIDLALLIETSVPFSLSGSNVSSLCDIEENLWPCDCDENQIGQVIDNIVINAQQAMPVGGKIIVSARNITISTENAGVGSIAGNYIRISIKDKGIGITKEFLSKIFDPFFTTKAMGHGLGLATVYSIVNRHGGWIDVESEPGTGTTFHVFLPASQAARATGQNRKPDQHKGIGMVLIMDDEEIMRETQDAMLTNMGYEVTTARDGQEALGLFTKAYESGNRFVCAILDLTIPNGMGGKDTIKAIRHIDDKIIVIVASGYADDPVMMNPTEYGFTAKIAKPFRKTELAKLLEMHLINSA